MSVVLCDVDGVVSSFTEAVLDTAFEFTGMMRWPSDITTWSMWHHLGATKDELKAIKAEISRPGWCSSIQPFPGAKDFIEALAEQHEVFFVTSPWNSVTWMGERSQWLIDHFGHTVGSRVVHTAHKHLVQGDVLLDDKPKNVREWGRAHPLGLPLLFEQPSNRSDNAGLIRVTNYRDVFNALDDFNSEILK